MSSILTLAELNEKHDKIFDVNTVKGVIFQQESKINQSTNFTAVLGFYPTEIVIKPTERGNIPLLASPQTSFMFSSETKTPDFDLTITLSKSYQVFNSILRPIKNFSCSVKTMHTGSKYINSLMTTFYIPHSTLTFKITTNDFKHISVTDFTISVGTNSNAAGLQLLKRNGLPMSFSAMYHKAWDQSKFITALIRDIDSNNKPNKLSNNLLCMRYQKNLNENWKAAVTFQINNQLVSSMAVAWRAKIGKSVIHSSASTIGLVKTQFRRHITPNFDLVLTGSLDHISNSYNAGIGLSWFPSKENK